MSRISSFANVDQVEEFLDREIDITKDELICAIIALSRHIERMESEIENLERHAQKEG